MPKINQLPSIGSVHTSDVMLIDDLSGENPITSKVTVANLGAFIANNYAANVVSVSSSTALATGTTLVLINNNEPLNITLPNPADTVFPIVFVTTQDVGESWVAIVPYSGENIQNGGVLYMNGPSSATLISDSNNWWITATYNMG